MSKIISFQRGSHATFDVNSTREFGRLQPGRRCSMCMKRDSVGDSRFGIRLRHACEDDELEFTRTIYRDEFARKNQ
jgi:hypothetical protein